MNKFLGRICSLNNVTRICFTLLLWGFILLSSQSVSVRVTCDEGRKFIGLRQAFFDFGSRSESTISYVEISMYNYRAFKRLFLQFCDITDAAVTLWLREGITTTKTKVPEGTWISEMNFFILVLHSLIHLEGKYLSLKVVLYFCWISIKQIIWKL